MSSIMCHLCIAKEVAEKMNYSYEYIFGSILPDLTKKIKGNTRIQTHYITEVKDGVLDTPNLDVFLKENKLDSEEKLGIYSHLIEDYVYFKKYVGKYIELLDNDINKIKFKFDNKIRNFSEYQEIFYHDFFRLNYYLINKYNLNINEIKKELKKVAKTEDVKKYIEEDIKEYNFVEGNLILFNEEEAYNYIDECSKEVIKMINNYNK